MMDVAPHMWLVLHTLSLAGFELKVGASYL